MNRWKLATLLVVGLVVTSPGLPAGLSEGAARAYTFYRTKETNEPLRWWQRATLEFTLSTVEPEETANANLQALVETAFEQWISAPCGLAPEVTFGGMAKVTQGTKPKSLRGEPDNVIVFIRSVAEWTRFQRSPTWIAITQIAHDPETGEIVDADIEINDGGYAFSFDDTPATGEVDFMSMLTHELGHFFGLDHSADASASMFATYATSPERALDARTLSQDDLDGICALYTDVPVHVVPKEDDGICCGGGAGLALWGAALLMPFAFLRRRAQGSGGSRSA